MTEYERTTVRQSVDGTVDPAPTRATAGDPIDRAAVVEPIGAQRTVVHERATTYVTGSTYAARVVGLLFGILQVLLALRILLLVLAAQHGNDIVGGILGATDPFVEPFRGMFRIDRISASGSVLDTAALVAFVGWTLVEALILAVIRVADRRAAYGA